MLNVLLQGVLGVASSAVTGYIDTKKAKAKQKLVKIEAETSLMEKQITGEIAWDVEAIKGSKESWVPVPGSHTRAFEIRWASTTSATRSRRPA